MTLNIPTQRISKYISIKKLRGLAIHGFDF